MNKISKVLFFISLGLATLTNAKEYAGINLCSKATTESITKVAETNGGKIKIYEPDENWPGTETIDLSNYSIGNLTTDIEVQLINGTVDYIKIQSMDGMLEYLSKKYGAPHGPKLRKDLFANVKVWTFSTQKFDPQLLLTLELSEPSITRIESGLSGGYGAHFIYQCKSTIGKAEAAKKS